MPAFISRELGHDEEFDPLALCPDTPFTQATFYGDWQKKLGREVKRFVITEKDEVVAYFQIIKYPLMFGTSYLYTPYGPVVKTYTPELLEFLKRELRALAQKERAVFVRLDFTPPAHGENERLLENIFTKARFYTYRSAYFQPRAEWALDVRKPEEQLLKEMHEKTRYSVRLAERKGITTEIVSSGFETYFEIFYELMQGTAERNGFSLHPKNYYQHIFENLGDNAYLSIARYGEKILSIYLVVQYGSVANYIFGGSSDEHREKVPTYIAHWVAICHSKKLGASFYNFGGISFGDVYKRLNMDGLTIFKKKFGGSEVIHSNFFDVVASPFWYHLYNVRKRIKNY